MAETKRTQGRATPPRRVSIATLAAGTFLVVLLVLVAVPSFLRARISANETEVVADTRAVISAEQTFASANFGYFDDVHHLCNGELCGGIQIPDYYGPDFINEELGRRSPHSKNGYQRIWSPIGRPPDLPESVSASSVLDYCYTSTPERLGWTGARSFAGTGTGAIYTDPTGAPYPCPVPYPPVWFCP